MGTIHFNRLRIPKWKWYSRYESIGRLPNEATTPIRFEILWTLFLAYVYSNVETDSLESVRVIKQKSLSP